jgi:hypothetical protein
MDQFSQFLMGGQPKSAFPQANPLANPSASKSSALITDELLDSLKRTESGSQKFALNKESKAMGDYQFIPSTVKMLHEQGYEFNPFNPKQARDAAKHYLTTLVEKTGSLDKALAAYGGHITKDPTAYINKVVGGTKQTEKFQDQSDSFSNFLMGGQPNKAETTTVKEKETVKEKQAVKKPSIQGPSDVLKTFAAPSMLALPKSVTEPIVGGAEALATFATGAIAPWTGTVYGIGKNIIEGKNERADRPENAEAVTYRPRTEKGQQYVENVAEAIPKELEKIPLYVPGAGTAGRLAQPSTTQVGAKVSKAAEPMIQRFEELKANAPKVASAEAVAPVVTQPTLTGVGAAKVEINPYAGKITGEETARGQYPTVKLSKIKEDVPVTEQALRSQIANEVLGDSGQVRSGVITGNENILRQEYTEARTANPTPRSEILKRQIADEQNALTRYAEKRIENTGASKNLPSDYERGQLMNDAIAGDDGLTGFLRQQKQMLFDEARNKVGDNPIQTNAVNNLLQNKQFRAGLGLKNNEGVAKSAEQLIELARTVGFEDRAGNILPPNSIASWKAVREALNAEWTRDNASTIAKINNAIDQDIAKAGGQDLYKKADNLHKAEKKIFESKGMKTLFGDVDPNGVQTGTNFEGIPKKLNSMPVDQWKHIYDTYDEMSKGRVRGADFDLEITPELIDYANAAKAEMKGALAREIFQAGGGKAGVWNQNSVNNLLNNPIRSKKIEHAFSPEEQKAFHTLNYAGHIMPGVHAYEGAALQGQRVGKFAEKLPMIGRETGAFTRIPFGATIGEKIGEKGEKFFKGKSEKKQAQKLQEEMTKNAEKGKTKTEGKEKTSLQDIYKIKE